MTSVQVTGSKRLPPGKTKRWQVRTGFLDSLNDIEIFQLDHQKPLLSLVLQASIVQMLVTSLIICRQSWTRNSFHPGESLISMRQGSPQYKNHLKLLPAEVANRYHK